VSVGQINATVGDRRYSRAVKRRFDPNILEIMDRRQPVSVELERDLQNLRELNRWFGSYALLKTFLRRWIKPGDNLRIVDLATGSGDIPRLIVDHSRQIGAKVEVHALDRQPSTVKIANTLSVDYPEISFFEGDILKWQPVDRYDIVLCTLVLHHFSEKDAVRVLQRCREISNKCVLVSDLRRGWLATAGVYLLTAVIFRQAMTRYDARLSAARAFSFGEMNEMAREAGWKNFDHRRFRFARQAIWVEAA
jgi:ubiquinone/menaquinone biosynthesis C-methylase UbiE